MVLKVNPGSLQFFHLLPGHIIPVLVFRCLCIQENGEWISECPELRPGLLVDAFITIINGDDYRLLRQCGLVFKAVYQLGKGYNLVVIFLQVEELFSESFQADISAGITLFVEAVIYEYCGITS